MPQQHLIDPAAYSSSAVLSTEIHRIHRRAWHLVCLDRDIPNDQDYYRRRVAVTDLVVHRIGSRITAYANVCPHRFSAFFKEDKGNSPIRCPYHLWTFDVDGIATGVPHRHGEALECYQVPALRLANWRTEQLGSFIFASEAPAESLDKFLGPMRDIFLQLSAVIGAERQSTIQDIEADWKVVLQNTVEFEHAFSVHTETFAKTMQKPLALVRDAETPNAISYTARMDTGRHDIPRQARLDAIFRRVDNPYPDGYRHHLVFPALTIGYTDNRQLALMDYQPLSAGRCRMVARLFDFAVPDLSAAEASMLDIVRPWDVQYAQRLFDEDRSICESVQRGLASRPGRMRGALMPGEDLVLRFQQIYQSWMADGGDADPGQT